MKPIVRIIARALFRAGGWGLLTLGTFDSSPLILPFGNDLLMLALSARHHQRVPYYALMATLGSLLGCLFTDWVSRKSARGLKKVVASHYLDYIRHQVETHAGWTLFVASLMPPPFPFTACVAAAAAFHYPRKKLFGSVAVGRFLRFLVEGGLAIHYGRWIIRQAESPLFEHLMMALVVISIGGSIFSLWQWGGEAKGGAAPEPESAEQSAG